jgi:hypothetical protein
MALTLLWRVVANGSSSYLYVRTSAHYPSTIIGNQHPTAIMNKGIIPVPDEVLEYRYLLFDLATPITLPAEEFSEVWAFVSSVYTNPRELARYKSFLGYVCSTA